MKSPCINCAQKEVGCFEECADCRAYREERKKRRIFGKRREAIHSIPAPTITPPMPPVFPPKESVTINDLAEAASRLAYVPFTIRG